MENIMTPYECLLVYLGDYTKEQQYASYLMLKMYYKERFNKLMELIKEETGFKINNRLSGKCKTWAKKVKARANYKCELCGSNKNLNAHHIINWEYSISGRYDLDNGQCLCEKCHRYVHSDKYIFDLYGRGDLYA